MCSGALNENKLTRYKVELLKCILEWYELGLVSFGSTLLKIITILKT